LAVATSLGVALCIAFAFDLLWGVQRESSDFLFKAGGFRQDMGSVGDIVVVGIDDRSLDELGYLQSWPRSYHADLVDVLAESDARVIVFDLLFAEPSPDDERLAASMRDAGNVVLPLVYTSTGYEVTGVGESSGAGSFIRPLDTLEEAAIALGHANVHPDEDGVVRRLPLAIRDGEDYQPALSLAAVAEYLRRPQAIESPIEDNHLLFAGRSIPLDDVNGMIVNYVAGSAGTGASTSFLNVPYVDAMRGEVAPDVFSDRLVLVGATASGIGDTFWTPTGRQMNGVDIHANTIHTILAGDFLRPAPSYVTVMLILLFALSCGMVVLRLRVLWATGAAISLCVAYFLVGFTVFDAGIMLNMVYPPMAIVVPFVGTSLYNITSERSEKRVITKTFGRYISAPVADKILLALEHGELKLGGEECEVTVAFADIRGFTAMSENVQPEELVSALNRYLSMVIKEVLRHDGMVNKFGGDSIMAVWNAPARCEEHALLATRAAVEAQRAIRDLQEANPTLVKMDFGIGVSTGRAVAGNLGSEDRSEYSVIGDCVNVAARLTSVAEGGKVWIGSGTFDLVRDCVEARALEPLTVKGKREVVQAYEVTDIRSALGCEAAGGSSLTACDLRDSPGENSGSCE
jgi:adenylate cyclase